MVGCTQKSRPENKSRV